MATPRRPHRPRDPETADTVPLHPETADVPEAPTVAPPVHPEHPEWPADFPSSLDSGPEARSDVGTDATGNALHVDSVVVETGGAQRFGRVLGLHDADVLLVVFAGALEAEAVERDRLLRLQP